MNGLLIAFEGIDGCGKNIQSVRAKNWLESLGLKTHLAHEPNDEYPIGQTIKKMLRGELPKTANAMEFQRLYIIDRAQDIVSSVTPELARGVVYIMERFSLSTLAYGMLDNVPPEELIRLHQEIIGEHLIWPRLNIVLDISAREAISRLQQGRDKTEFFEQETWLEKIRQNYLRLAKHPRFQTSIIVIDGSPDKETVFGKVKAAIAPLLPRN